MILKVQSKRKYLHIEVDVNGSLYVYADDRKWKGSQTKTLKDLDEGCQMGHNRITIPLDDFISIVEEK